MSSDSRQEKGSPDTQEHAIARLERQVYELFPLQKKLAACSTINEKLTLLDQSPSVLDFFDTYAHIALALAPFSPQYQYALKATIAIGQGPAIFTGWQHVEDFAQSFKELLDILLTVESFYEHMGGIVGYHIKTLELIINALSKTQPLEYIKNLPPPLTDIRQETISRSKIVLEGIYSIPYMAEIYVVGGAGDRLQLVDEKTKMALPVARLMFAGYTLLEHLVRDLEARESLAYKLTAKQSYTPIVLMTSQEKQNDREIVALLEEKNYFGRPRETFFRLIQPRSPVLCVDGKWAVSGPLQLIVKPGGHGVIWKLAEDLGAFDWLAKQQRSYCLVRQINNPLAGLDCNLLALAGFGYYHEKAFGFESVVRKPYMAEGMNVLKEQQENTETLYTISNIEYTEQSELGPIDLYPANTNILYANLEDVRRAAKKLPLPGLLVNMKQPVATVRDNRTVVLRGARLESTMQNIADAIQNRISLGKEKLELAKLHTFLLLNDRAKTMSVTKRAFDGKKLHETPEGCFYDLIKENLRLLQTYCLFEIEAFGTLEEYITKGPGALFLYHPALGPLYSIIAQKISKGRLYAGAELECQASEVSLYNLDVDGSLRIHAVRASGVQNEETGYLEFTSHVGRCSFENVRIKNKGIDHSMPNSYCSGDIARKESARIILKGDSECIAKNVLLEGDIEIVVESGTRVILEQSSDGTLKQIVQDITEAHPHALCWKYQVNQEHQIILSKHTQ